MAGIGCAYGSEGPADYDATALDVAHADRAGDTREEATSRDAHKDGTSDGTVVDGPHSDGEPADHIQGDVVPSEASAIDAP
jgi:hypothetical protein